MKIFLMEDMAFVELRGNQMLCIGSKIEVDQASPEKLIRMIWEAVAYSYYRGMTTKGQVLH